jgi:predicted HicB family RNase H-like nuclease
MRESIQMIYKGYTGVLEVEEDSDGLFGIVLGTRDTITFVGQTVEEARKSFQESVDCYLEHCASMGKEPDRPFTGRFNVQISSEAHRELEELAHMWKVNLNDVVIEALDRFIAANRPVKYKPIEPVKAPKRRRKVSKADRAAAQAADEAPKRRKAAKAV